MESSSRPTPKRTSRLAPRCLKSSRRPSTIPQKMRRARLRSKDRPPPYSSSAIASREARSTCRLASFAPLSNTSCASRSCILTTARSCSVSSIYARRIRTIQRLHCKACSHTAMSSARCLPMHARGWPLIVPLMEPLMEPLQVPVHMASDEPMRP